MTENVLLAILGGIHLLILGSYAFTFKLWQKVDKLANNHITHLQGDVNALFNRVRTLEKDTQI